MDAGQGKTLLSFFGMLAVLVVLVYALFGGLLFFLQSRLIYYPNLPGRDLSASPADIGLAYETVSLVTTDHIRLHGWFVKAPRQRGVLLFFHGNAGNISHRLDSLRIFTGLGLSTLIIDYRGYGRSEGTVSEQGTYLDAEAAWQYLVRDRKIDPQDIIIFGRSLGAAVAAHLAANHPAAGLILESAFTSVPDLAAVLYPMFPVRLLSRYHYDTRRYLKNVAGPKLIIHSPDDEIIPFANGLALFAAASGPKTLLKIRGDHNEGFLASGPLYIRGLETFVDEVLGRAGEL